MEIKNIFINRKNLPIYGTLILLGGVFVFIILAKLNTSNNSLLKGILAVNSDRKEYLSGETATIQIGVLDSNGQTLCDANLELKINGTKTKDIKKSSTCGDNMTNNPDYFYKFVPQKTGTYKLELTNLDSKNITKNTFKVVDKRDLDIIREAATRINPVLAERYPIRLIVKTNKDFQGEISDTVPSSFTIPWQGPAKIIDKGEEGKIISWQVKLKAGETKELIYEYSAPKAVPAIYKLGNNNEWYIVAAK